MFYVFKNINQDSLFFTSPTHLHKLHRFHSTKKCFVWRSRRAEMLLRKLNATKDFLKTIRTRRLYFTRVIISARSAIELINAADPLDHEVYANGTREGNAFSRLPRSLVGLLVRCTPCCAEQRE